MRPPPQRTPVAGYYDGGLSQSALFHLHCKEGCGGELAIEDAGPHSTLYRCLYCSKTYTRDRQARGFQLVEETRPVDSVEWVYWSNDAGDTCTAALTAEGRVPWDIFALQADGWDEIMGGPGACRLYADVGEPPRV